MKKIVTSASVMALGAVSLHAIYAPELSRLETGKPWTISASLRGFYDDNWATASDAWRAANPGGNYESWGFEARPYIGFNFPMEQTFIGLSYLNSSRFFEARARDEWDFSHEFSLKFDHAFSPRYSFTIRESLLYGQEPDTAGIVALPLRADKSYLRNRAAINFAGQLTPEIGFTVGYNNVFWDYLDSGPRSYSAVLDRLEHSIPFNLRWNVRPDLVALIGYQFGLVNYTGNDVIDAGNTLRSDSRNSMSHTVYLGGEYDVTGQLKLSASVGASHNSYDNVSGADQWTPYADAKVSYAYTVGSHADLGFRHTVSATDAVYLDLGGRPTLDIEASALYLQIQHQFTPKLTGNLLAQYQWSSFHWGGFAGQSENLLILGLHLDYQINPHLAVEAGYNFDWLDSDIRGPIGANPLAELRTYDRNRVYFGIRGTY